MISDATHEIERALEREVEGVDGLKKRGPRYPSALGVAAKFSQAVGEGLEGGSEGHKGGQPPVFQTIGRQQADHAQEAQDVHHLCRFL